MKYLKFLATIACVLLGWIGYELRSLASQAGKVEVRGDVDVSGDLSFSTYQNYPLKVEIEP